MVPARFSLGGYRGTQVFATGYPQTTAVACPGRPRTDEIEQTLPERRRRRSATATASTPTPGAARRPGRRRYVVPQVMLRFKDGQQRTALFRLR